MVTNPAVHELNNIEVQGGDSDYAVVNIAGSTDDVLLEYDDSAGQWSFAGVVSGSDLADGSVTVEELAVALGTDSNNPVSGTTYFENLDSGSVNTGELNTENSSTVVVLSDDQTISHNTETLVQFDETKLNQIGFDTANHKFVSETDQTVSFSCKIRPEKDLTTLRINIKVNGKTEMNITDLSGVGSFVDKVSHTEELELDANDEVELFLRGKTSDSSSFNIQSGSTRTTFRMRRV
jgi:phage baseplate assembly protein gpV